VTCAAGKCDDPLARACTWPEPGQVCETESVMVSSSVATTVRGADGQSGQQTVPACGTETDAQFDATMACDCDKPCG